MTRDDVFEVIKRSTLEVLPGLSPEQVTVNHQLRDLGANSIDRLEIVTMSMERLRVKIPMLELARANNISGLVDVLWQNCPA